MKAVNCKKSRIDPTVRALVTSRYGRNQVFFKPGIWLAGGKFVDFGGIDAAVNRTCHQDQARRRSRMLIFSHQRSRRQSGHTSLADGYEVRTWADDAKKIHHIFGVFVQTETAGFERPDCSDAASQGMDRSGATRARRNRRTRCRILRSISRASVPVRHRVHRHRLS